MLKQHYFWIYENSNIWEGSNESMKNIFNFGHNFCLQNKIRSQTDHDHLSKLSLLKNTILQKGSIFKPLSPETFAKKISQSIKTIFYLSYHKSMLKKWNFKTDCTHFSKLCLDERVVLFIKQIFWILENLNVCKGSQRVKKKNILYLNCKEIILSKPTSQNVVCSNTLF